MRLEVTPPGGPASYTPTWTTPTKAAGKDDEYTFEWTGPWTYTDSTATQLMPRGNYKLVVVGKRQTSETEIKSDPPYDKVSLVEVTSVKLEAMAGAPALDGNPAVPALPAESADRARLGGGSRIFAEAVEAPTDANPNLQEVRLMDLEYRMHHMAEAFDPNDSTGPRPATKEERRRVAKRLLADLVPNGRGLADIDGQFQPEALRLLARLQAVSGDFDGERQTLRRIVRDFPNRAAGKAAREELTDDEEDDDPGVKPSPKPKQ